jgi:hypothetical protein
MSDELPRTFEEGMAWAKARLDETGETDMAENASSLSSESSSLAEKEVLVDLE